MIEILNFFIWVEALRVDPGPIALGPGFRKQRFFWKKALMGLARLALTLKGLALKGRAGPFWQLFYLCG